MKRLMCETRQTQRCNFAGAGFKERRKAYYHGKYNKKILLLLLLVACLALITISQSA